MTDKQKIEYLLKKLAKKKNISRQNFLKLKIKLASELKIPNPRNLELLGLYKKLKKKQKIKTNPELENMLKKRPIRSLSGVAVVSLLTKPWPCPGTCIFCPLEKGIPKSYLSGEPAVERAKLLKFDPYIQVSKRIQALEKTGHPTDKIELIVIGGTWSFLPKQYQNWFIKQCFDAANNLKSKNLEQAQKRNEKTKHRIIGLTLETRPDYITKAEILRMRKLGCTRVEMGVQIVDDQILKKNARGHGRKEVIKATKLLKDAGFKICYHIMPNLLGSSPKKDLSRFEELFINSDFQPDMLKIYPCVVVKGSRLYQIWKKKKYRPYTINQLISLLIKMKFAVPSYVRINRLIRDIPAWQIQAGSKISNLREILQKKMKEQGKTCQCIRCREIKDLKSKFQNLKLIRQDYSASGGQEIFLSYEDKKQNILAAFLRLRLPNKTDQEPIIKILQNASIIREIHTYGQLVPISQLNRQATQHLGLGKKLIQQAEKISQQAGYKKIAVISGLGVREYYRKLGYRLKDTYMLKNL